MIDSFAAFLNLLNTTGTIFYDYNLGAVWCSNDTSYGRPVNCTDSEAVKGPNHIAFAGTSTHS